MKPMLLTVVLILSLVFVGTAQAQWGRDRGHGQPRFSISVGFGQASCIGQTGVVNGVLCQLVQTPFGLQWVPLQQPCNTGYNPGYNGFGGGVNNDAYQKAYQQTTDRLQQEKFDRQQRDARQAAQRDAEQRFNGYYPQPQYYAPPLQQFVAPQYYAPPAPTYGGGYQGWNCPSAR